MTEPGEPLSERELDILRRVATGASNREIAQTLTISHNTVKVHLRNIFTKLSVSSRTEATAVAWQMGVLDVPERNGGEAVNTPPVGPNDAGNGLEPLLEPAVANHPPAAPSRRWQPALILVVVIVTLALISLGAARLLAGRNEGQGQTASPVGVTGDNATIPAAEPQATVFPEEVLSDNRWRRSRPLPTARANMAVAAVGLNLYVIGGETDGGVVNTVEIYDTDRRQWQAAAPKLTAVTEATAAVLFGEIYVAGGRQANGEPTAVVEAYSPANNAWRPVPSLPRPSAGGLALSDGSFLYYIGGWDGENVLSDTFVFDPVAGRWNDLPPMPQARAYATGGIVAGQLYVVGGFDGQSPLASCHTYDLPAGAWAECPAMSTPRQQAGAATLVNRLYVVGGNESAGAAAEFYDPAEQTWESVDVPMADDTAVWASLGVATIETRLYAVGGRRGQMLQAENYVFTPFVHEYFIPAAADSRSAEE